MNSDSDPPHEVLGYAGLVKERKDGMSSEQSDNVSTESASNVKMIQAIR